MKAGWSRGRRRLTVFGHYSLTSALWADAATAAEKEKLRRRPMLIPTSAHMQ